MVRARKILNQFQKRLLYAFVAAAVTGALSRNLSVAAVVFAALLIIVWLPVYIRYANDNPQGYWFKRKLFGWGWTPVTWQGWASIAIYLALVFLLAARVNNDAAPNIVFVSFILPSAVLTLLLIYVAYRTGEKPKWEWGGGIKKYER